MMKYPLKYLPSIAAVLLFAAPAGAADAMRGKDLYHAVGCAACHGGLGQGATLTGPRIAPDPAPLPAFRNFVRRPANIMPPYSAQVLSDADLADIQAYLVTVPAPPPVSEAFGH